MSRPRLFQALSARLRARGGVAGLFSWSGRRRAEQDVQRELDLHLELETRRNIEQGMSPEDADAGSAGRTRQRAADPGGRPRRLVLARARYADPEPRPHAPRAAAGRPGSVSRRLACWRLGTGGTTAVFTLIDRRHAPAAAGVGPGPAVQDRRRGRHRRHGPPRPLGTVPVPAVRAIEGRRTGVRGRPPRSTGAARC